ncbi:hypothetical protein [Burkholderia sp. BCC0405]|uniref:hypothetical protein n=1 Tax=Burkholderia sp. BCC0405 TaxID=2676298 RepID=UPI00158C54D0|nr:hypothetical protein [Burkholderia sp. BCC0405]
MNMTEVVQAIRGGLIQQDRLFKTSIPALPENALVPRRVVTYCELGRPTRIRGGQGSEAHRKQSAAFQPGNELSA